MKYKKTKLRPSVGFSLSKDFNDVVAVDLKPTNGIHILHIIDYTTRFSAAAVVKSKKKRNRRHIYKALDCHFWCSR